MRASLQYHPISGNNHMTSLSTPDISSPSTWDSVALSTMLSEERYPDLMANVQCQLDTFREPRMVDWLEKYGYQQGHVPALFAFTQNLMRYSKSRVPSVEDVQFGIGCCTILLLRVAQDVASCRLDMAKSDRDHVYAAFAAKVKHWILRWNCEILPHPGDVKTQVEHWLEMITSNGFDLPLPTWATSFTTGILGTFYWNVPTSHDVVAFKRCTNVVATRRMVTAQFIEVLEKAQTWEDFLAFNVC